jgi:AcrR family transcriptional regulator
MVKDDPRAGREARIFEAAYETLADHGYGGASMLRIAKAAKASNETLYRWYGDKDGLFTAMARDNAAETRRLLTEALSRREDAWASLERLAPVFLRMILGDRAILLNRAAAADPSGALGVAVSAGGREEVTPLLRDLMERLCAGRGRDPAMATDWFVSLLVGDLQIKRVISALPALSDQAIEERCGKALPALRALICGGGDAALAVAPSPPRVTPCG